MNQLKRYSSALAEKHPPGQDKPVLEGREPQDFLSLRPWTATGRPRPPPSHSSLINQARRNATPSARGARRDGKVESRPSIILCLPRPRAGEWIKTHCPSGFLTPPIPLLLFFIVASEKLKKESNKYTDLKAPCLNSASCKRGALKATTFWNQEVVKKQCHFLTTTGNRSFWTSSSLCRRYQA